MKTCGKCGYMPKEYWLEQSWGGLRIDPNQELPDEWSKGSKRKIRLLCECGKTVPLSMNQIEGQKRTSCGQCSTRSKEFWLSQTWGSLRIDPDQPLPDTFNPETQLVFLCTCGRRKTILLRAVTRGNTASCGLCGYKPREFWLSQQWGNLHLDPEQELPEEWGAGSNLPVRFICACGRSLEKGFKSVISCSTTCTRCLYKPREFWLSQKWGSLVIDPNQDLPDEWSTQLTVNCLCDCGETHTTRMSNLTYGYTRSCGCAKTGTHEGSPAWEIHKYVAAIVPDAQLSYWFKNSQGQRREYDIFIPSKNIAIEYHGLYWHSEKCKGKGKGDYEKYREASQQGTRLVQIYQDEWEEHRTALQEMLHSLLSPLRGKRVTPVFSVEETTSPEVRGFLDEHHYLGAAGGGVTVVAKHGEEIVGGWVFQKRSDTVVIWHRACWNHKYRAWNPHEKALRLVLPFLKIRGYRKMISFSDNRFHTGKLYEKLGFKFEKEIPPDYTYTDTSTRRSKTKFRVPAGISEKDYAESRGWYRVWDSGKKRFALDIV